MRTFLFTNYSSSLPVIKELIRGGVNLVGVLFSPKEIKRLSWRKRILNLLKTGSFNEPKNILKDHKIPVYFVSNYNEAEAENILRNAEPDLLLIYGTKIIKTNILAIPKTGTLNAHSSLLPKYRGAKSEFWMFYNNETQYAGVSIHWVTPGLDEGDIFMQQPLEVKPDDTPTTLREKSRPLAGKLFVKTIECIKRGELIRIKQDESKASKFKRPTPEDVKEFQRRHTQRKNRVGS